MIDTTTTTGTRTPAPEGSDCPWCYATGTAVWTVDDGYGAEPVCTLHGTEWFPALFPESDTTPIECIVAEIRSRVSLDKPSYSTTYDHFATTPSESRLAARRLAHQVAPYYPLMGHRPGLRANDLMTLASAFMILANEGGTAHLG